MVFLLKNSDSRIQGETAYHGHPTNRKLFEATATVNTEVVHSRTSKKRGRDKLMPTTPTIAAVHEISDYSDASSDEEKSPQKLKSPALLTKKRRTHHKVLRKVSFGDVASTTRYYAATLTKAELKDLKRDVWFTKQDRLRSQAESMKILKTFRLQNPKEVTQFSTVYRTSMQVPFSKESSDYLERTTVTVPLTIRGMEWGIAPKLRKRRKEHIQSVLFLQEHIRDVNLRERFVSSRSLQSSRPARIMARIIGEGDESASKSGTTSTALHVRTVLMAKLTTKETSKKKVSSETKLPLREKHRKQNLPLSSTKGMSNTSGINCRISTKGCITRATKIGHARRRRRPIVWKK